MLIIKDTPQHIKVGDFVVNGWYSIINYVDSIAYEQIQSGPPFITDIYGLRGKKLHNIITIVQLNVIGG